jgi:hypothetical protein
MEATASPLPASEPTLAVAKCRTDVCSVLGMPLHSISLMAPFRSAGHRFANAEETFSLVDEFVITVIGEIGAALQGDHIKRDAAVGGWPLAQSVVIC